jgi:WhiB family redox-sensing transcriptional regulator
MKLCKSGDHELPGNHTGRCSACRTRNRVKANKKQDERRLLARQQKQEDRRAAAAEIYASVSLEETPGLPGMAWMDKAPCRDMDPEIFFPPEDEEGSGTYDHQASRELIQAAKKVCDGCSVRLKCLEYAYALDIEYGVFGGMTAYERGKTKRLAS